MDFVDKVIAWESGEMNDWDTLNFFSELIKTGQCWSLQGCYGRTAESLIDNGYIDKDGTINVRPPDEEIEDKNFEF